MRGEPVYGFCLRGKWGIAEIVWLLLARGVQNTEPERLCENGRLDNLWNLRISGCKVAMTDDTNINFHVYHS